MRRYKLKEKVKEYISKSLWDVVADMDYWCSALPNFELQKILEEVPQRTELELFSLNMYNSIYKKDMSNITDQERDLCEKALNGELLDIDSLDDEDFGNWSCKQYYNINGNKYSSHKLNGIKAVLKAYLKQKK